MHKSGTALREADTAAHSTELDSSVARLAESGEWASLLRLICRHATRVLAQGGERQVRRWVRAFPPQVAAESPWITYWSGAAMQSESPVAARGCFTEAWPGFHTRSDRAGELLCSAGVLETYQLEWTSFRGAHEWIRRLEACLATGIVLESAEAQLRVLGTWLFARTQILPELELSLSCMRLIRPLLEGDVDVNERIFAARSLLIALCSRADQEGLLAHIALMRAMLDEPGCTARSRASALGAIAHGLLLAGAWTASATALQEVERMSRGRALTLREPLHEETRQLLALFEGNRHALTESMHALRRSLRPECHYGMSLLASAQAQLADLNADRNAALSHAVAAVSRADSACALDAQLKTRLVLAAHLAACNEHTEAKRVVEEARNLFASDPRERWRGECELMAAYVALRGAEAVECHALLPRALMAASSGSWLLTRFRSQMAELCMEARRADIGADTARELIWRYYLPPPPTADGAWPWVFKVFVLGRFQVLRHGAPLPCSQRPQRKPLELLQALIAFGGNEVGAGTLIDALWPESEGDAGYHALENTLCRLRHMLGVPGAISMAGSKLSLDGRLFWADMWVLEGELNTAAIDNTDPGRQLARLRGLYAGQFLSQELEKAWVVERRHALGDRFLRAIRTLAHRYESRGLWAEAAEAFQFGIDVDGLAEDLHRGLIACYRELGDHVAAVTAYRRCSELLTRTLGIQPSLKTRALYQSVRQEVASGAP